MFNGLQIFLWGLAMKNTGPVTLEKWNNFPEASALAYRSTSNAMLQDVNQELLEHPDLAALTGDNPVEMMLNNHENHVSFMATVFQLPAPSLLPKIIPWVYRAYAARGYSHDYFPVELDAWMRAVNTHIGDEVATPVLEVYQWMRDQHSTWIELSKRVASEPPSKADQWSEARNAFLNALLNGDHAACVELVTAEIAERRDPEAVFSHVMTPSMYRVGEYWESGAISVAEEHIASSICSRCITHLYSSSEIPKRTAESPRALVTASPGEYHQLGALMFSDSLERDGWIVSFCGANTPARDFMVLARSFKPDLVAVSVTMPYNLVDAQQLIRSLRSDSTTSEVSIMVGGQAFLLEKQLVDIVGADAFGLALEDSVRLARELISS
jgi:methanogenic corrinoid protein MtbC1